MKERNREHQKQKPRLQVRGIGLTERVFSLPHHQHLLEPHLAEFANSILFDAPTSSHGCRQPLPPHSPPSILCFNTEVLKIWSMVAAPAIGSRRSEIGALSSSGRRTPSLPPRSRHDHPKPPGPEAASRFSRIDTPPSASRKITDRNRQRRPLRSPTHPLEMKAFV